MIFLEDQSIEDFDQKKNPKSFSEELDDLGSVFPHVMHDKHIEDVQEQQMDIIDRKSKPVIDVDA